jgi:hypothetical protein
MGYIELILLRNFTLWSYKMTREEYLKKYDGVDINVALLEIFNRLEVLEQRQNPITHNPMIKDVDEVMNEI